MIPFPWSGFGATLKDTLAQGTGHGGGEEEIAAEAALGPIETGYEPRQCQTPAQKQKVAVADHLLPKSQGWLHEQWVLRVLFSDDRLKRLIIQDAEEFPVGNGPEPQQILQGQPEAADVLGEHVEILVVVVDVRPGLGFSLNIREVNQVGLVIGGLGRIPEANDSGLGVVQPGFRIARRGGAADEQVIVCDAEEVNLDAMIVQFVDGREQHLRPRPVLALADGHIFVSAPDEGIHLVIGQVVDDWHDG